MKITNQSTLTSKITLPDQTEEEVQTQSNLSETENMTLSLLKELKSNPEYGKANDEIEETVKLTNNSQYDVTDVTYQCATQNADFVAGSVKINNVEYQNYDAMAGFNLPDDIVKDGGEATIIYKIKLKADATADATDVGKIYYSVNEITGLNEQTNESTISLVSNLITIEKTSNLSAVISGQTLMFQNVITNKGNEKNTNLNFVDPIPAGTKFVEGSVKVNNESKPDYNPATGFALDDLDVGQSITVTFDVTVD